MVDGYETMLPEKMPAMDSIEEIRLSPTAYCSSWAFQNILETLEELSLSGTFTDEGVTGIPRDKCKDVLRFKMYNEVDAVKLRESVCIGNLKNLYQLHLKSNFITDVSILHGVACVKAVTSLSLSAEKITDISIVCIINNLQKLKRLHLNKCSLLSVELQFAVWKEFSEEIILDFEEIKHLLNAVTKQVRFSEDGMKDVLECIDPDKVNYFQGAFLPCLRNSESDMKDSLIGTSNK
ncbi:unnamed protein product [Allacma fusca]|uniref:Uncharacterized protein n=1 Tax=Allacma fusca TaxID=39272 RepID=A0A8J2K1N7_9HEXA|nr:unnamed protein product [Allacma fusca]